jgi:hypothetical protein
MEGMAGRYGYTHAPPSLMAIVAERLSGSCSNSLLTVPPYRMGIETIQPQRNPTHTFWQVTRRQNFPGRYGPSNRESRSTPYVSAELTISVRSDAKFKNDTPNVVHMTVKPQDIVDEEDAKLAKQGGRDGDGNERTPGCRCILM